MSRIIQIEQAQRARLATATPAAGPPVANLYAAMAELAQSLSDHDAGYRRPPLTLVAAVPPAARD